MTVAREVESVVEYLPLAHAAGSRWKGAGDFVRRKPLGAAGFLFIVFFGLVALLGPGLRLGGTELVPVLTPHDPNTTHLTQRLDPPSGDHWFGTDDLGRDVFSRLVYGVRPSMLVGFLASVLGVGIGTAVGLISGYRGGLLDLLIQRTVDALMAIPPLLLLMTLASVFQPSLRNVVVMMVVFVAPSASRVVRSAVLGLRTCPFVEAACVLGASDWRIVFRHILPNVVAPVLVLMSVVIGFAIVVEAGASFLGFGVQPPNSSLGSMLSANVGQAMIEQPWMALAPGIAITLMVLSFNLLGDALRDVLDPRLRGNG